jgi:hypothetical protein
MKPNEIVGMVIGIVLAIPCAIILWHMYWTQFRKKPEPQAPEIKVEFVSESELPDILKDAIVTYMTAKKNNRSFSFSWSMLSDGKLVSLANCPNCNKTNKLDTRGLVGAKCSACRLPLEKNPKPVSPAKASN